VGVASTPERKQLDGSEDGDVLSVVHIPSQVDRLVQGEAAAPHHAIEGMRRIPYGRLGTSEVVDEAAVLERVEELENVGVSCETCTLSSPSTKKDAKTRP
jgi:hypothetical protein